MWTVAGLRQTLLVALPHGSPLAKEIWERRHRGIVILLWILKEVAAAWRSAVRTADLLARYGGEGFGLLLPACTLDDAIDVVKRMRVATPDEVTCSIGLASWDFRESAADLVRRADEALYDAKAGGRDRFVTAAMSH
jgi:diguanylate cyclase (GGDEF)-like protein